MYNKATLKTRTKESAMAQVDSNKKMVIVAENISMQWERLLSCKYDFHIHGRGAFAPAVFTCFFMIKIFTLS